MNDTALDTPAAAPLGQWLIVAAALAVSLGLVWLLTGNALVTLAYAGGLVVLGAAARLFARPRVQAGPVEFALPDWSVTVAATEHDDLGVAVTDRAGRLVCANTRFEDWFGASAAPPRMPVDAPSQERLALAARAAWRDGKGAADLVEGGAGDLPGRWRVHAARAGRGEDFLVWRFAPLAASDPMADLVRMLDGKLGRALAQAGISAAIVDPDGTIRATSAGFALRAIGDAGASLAGVQFTSLLMQDEDDRLSWARDGRRGGALTLYYLPVADPDLATEPDPDTTPMLMLIADAGIGLGGGGESAAAAPHLEALLGQLPLGLAMADRDGRLLFANAAFMRAAGREGEKPPTYPTDLVVREDKGALADAIRRYALGPAAAGDIAIRLAGQAEEPASLSLAGVRGLGDAAVLLGLTDSSEETRLKKQVAQATKMQAVGQLAGGVAHDFNNVLTAILGTCDLMLLRHTPGDSDYDDIQQIRANSNRAASLTRQLLAFSRQQTLRPEVLQLPDVVTDVSNMLRRIIGEKIKLVVTHDRNLGPVRADPTQLEQVIVNLCVNARDAMHAQTGRAAEGAGRLSLSTRRVTAHDVRAMRTEIIPAGDYTALIVEDTGSGIAPENLGKIFEPFFTTKGVTKGSGKSGDAARGGMLGGTGLGLSTVYGIVKQSGGFIFAESELGKGTRFTVYLPVHHVSPEEAARLLPVEQRRGVIESRAPVEAPRQWSGGGRLLLVEDEDPVRMVAERALTRSGYTVTTARDGEEGLDIFRERPGDFDLVVSDVVMPGMDGPSMVHAIRELSPALPILFMSGYAEEQLRNEIDLVDMHFIPKPFSVQQIGEKVAEVLSGQDRAAASVGPAR